MRRQVTERARSVLWICLLTLLWAPLSYAREESQSPAASDGTESASNAEGANRTQNGSAESGESGESNGAEEAGEPSAAPVVSPVDPNADPDVAELIREIEMFAIRADNYRDDVRRLANFQYEGKRTAIEGEYSTVVDELTLKERLRREEAIERFENFLARYPDNPRYTPDAVFRLAELHFERSNDGYIAALEEYDRRARAFDEGRIEDPPKEPRQDYARTIELFDRLIQRWPDYRNIDGAYYLKGYCLLEMGEGKPAAVAFQRLVDRRPNSRFVPETWTRIGEYHFDYNELPQAIFAYEQVLEFPESPYYDKALYKLAWTYYRNDQYHEAIARFRELIEFSDERAIKTGIAGSDLRAEAIQYLAISLQEEDWDADGLPDPESGLARALRYVKGDREYEVEVLEALAEIYFDSAKYEETVETIRFLIQQFPRNPANPQLHSRMIVALERLRLFDDAFAERDQLAENYGDGSVWIAANAANEKAISDAANLAEQALIQAATYHHTRAQQLKDQAVGGDFSAEQEAIREYQLAALAYERYLQRYPKSDNQYDLSFFYAECLYYSFRFDEAAAQYEEVRDSELGTKYQEFSAFSAIIARENSIKKMVEGGQLPPKRSLTGAAPTEQPDPSAVAAVANDGEVRIIEPEVIPEPVLALVAARELYIAKEFRDPKEPSKRPRVAYKTGELYFDFKEYDKAREWFSWLIDNYPREQVTVYAANSIIESYRVANDWQKMAEWSEIIAQANLGTEEERRALQAEVRTLKVGALFKQAERLFADGDYEKAADEYIRLVTENPGNKFADRALNNAAVAYEKTRRFESATNIYERLYQNYPDSEFAEYALYRVGLNAERFYDFDRAIRTNLLLVNKFPSSEHRAEALYQAALLQEQLQRYRDAAKNFERYADLFPERDDTAVTYFRTGRNYEKLSDTKNMSRIYETFARRYGSDPKNNGMVIEGLARIAEVYKSRNNERAARKAYTRVIDQFNSRGMPRGSFESRYPAEAAFTLIEYDFESYARLKLSGSLSNQGRVIKRMQRELKDLQRRYAEVTGYKSLEWTLAAFYRLGHLYQVFAEALYEAPIPANFGPDEEDMYRTQLEDLAIPIEDKAIEHYELAYGKAREFKIANEWTRRILASLNKYKPSEYPLFKEERRALARASVTPSVLLSAIPVETAPIADDTSPPSAPEDDPAIPVAEPER